jgi:hypothetical protein
VLLAALLAGCSTPQGRTRDSADEAFRREVEMHSYRHGSRGLEIARTFNSRTFKDAMRESPIDDRVGVDEFYTVRVARDVVRRDLLSDAGYTRRRTDRETGRFFYEFFDLNWKLLAYLNGEGELFSMNASGKALARGKCQLDDALIAVYVATPGQSFNIYDYDEAKRKGSVSPRTDPKSDVDPDREGAEIRGRSPRDRGVAVKSQREIQPIVELRRYKTKEIGSLTDGYRKDKFDEAKAKELQALREQRRGTEAPDGSYGGLEYKDGQPVGADGQPLKRGEAGK